MNNAERSGRKSEYFNNIDDYQLSSQLRFGEKSRSDKKRRTTEKGGKTDGVDAIEVIVTATVSAAYCNQSMEQRHDNAK